MRKSTIIILTALTLAGSVGAQTAQDIRKEYGKSKKTTITAVQQARSINLMLNPNTAPLDSLVMLPGIGPKTAQSIVDYRVGLAADAGFIATGADVFECVQDLDWVKGIGPKTVTKLTEFIALPVCEDN